MERAKSLRSFLAENWLVLLIAAQPLLDFLAYWNQNSVATSAGYIRLLIMLAIPLYLLVTLKKKKRFILAMGTIGLLCLLHVANSFRVGYIDPFFDIAYLARVAQMPILAVCFIYLIRDERTKRQAVKGIAVAGAITLAGFVAAVLTGTDNCTYGAGLGISGWVIDDNRCANSILFVTLSTFAVCLAVRSEKLLVNISIPAIVTFLLIINGTKACYMGLFALLLAYAAFLLMEKPVLGRRIRWRVLLVLVLLIAISVVVYPYSPRAKMDAFNARLSTARQGEIEAGVAALGYDLSTMTLEEKLNTPEVRQVFEYYYLRYMVGAIPDLFDRFGYEPVFRYFNMSTDVARLIDTRQIKLCYSNLVWQESDSLTRLVGFEVTNLGYSLRDLENDWPAIFYYYGYIGLAFYAAFVLYFLWLVLKRLIRDFKGSFTLLNFCLFICLILQIALAQFSGAILRRPNVSIYMSVVLALIYYQTSAKPAGEALPGEDGL